MMTHSPASHLKLVLYRPRRRRRTGWNEIEHKCEMAIVAADLLGPSLRRCGDELWWHCPFHDGFSPSLWVAFGDPRWACMGCGAGGNAVALVMRIRKIGFGEAIDWLCDRAGSTSETTVRDDHKMALGLTAGPDTPVEHTPAGRLRLCRAST
jgi:CHC2 zinc finger